MESKIPTVAMLMALALVSSAGAGEQDKRYPIEARIALPDPGPFHLGDKHPVENLVVELTLTNTHRLPGEHDVPFEDVASGAENKDIGSVKVVQVQPEAFDLVESMEKLAQARRKFAEAAAAELNLEKINEGLEELEKDPARRSAVPKMGLERLDQALKKVQEKHQEFVRELEEDRQKRLSYFPGARFDEATGKPQFAWKLAEGTTEETKNLPTSFAVPKLSPHNFVELVLYRLPESDEAAQGQKPELIKRLDLIEGAVKVVFAKSGFLGSGESTAPIHLPVGKYYRFVRAGKYSLRARLFSLPGDITGSDKESEEALTAGTLSNELTFEILPYQTHPQMSMTDLRRKLDAYASTKEPQIPYMVYLIRGAWGDPELVYATLVTTKLSQHYELHRLCRLHPTCIPQVTHPQPRQVVVVAQNRAGNWRQYRINFKYLNPVVEVTDRKGPATLKPGGTAE